MNLQKMDKIIKQDLKLLIEKENHLQILKKPNITMTKIRSLDALTIIYINI